MSELLITKTEGALCRVILNRPSVKNVLNIELIRAIRDFFQSLDPKFRAVLIEGSNDFFCAGGDLNWMKSSLSKSVKENEGDALELAQMLRAVDETAIPTIALVKGGAFGGGVGIVAACDVVIADEKAVFSLSEVKLGLIPATIGPIVMRKIGLSQARRLYLTGKRFLAAEAKQMNLVHEVAAAADLSKVVDDYLKELETAGPDAVRTAKSLIRQLHGNELWKPDVSESTSKILSKIRVGAEAQEGMAAFLEKRAPKWKASLK